MVLTLFKAGDILTYLLYKKVNNVINVIMAVAVNDSNVQLRS